MRTNPPYCPAQASLSYPTAPMRDASVTFELEPESPSAVMLRGLLKERRLRKELAEKQHAEAIEKVEQWKRVATAWQEQADAEIAAILADIKAIGGRDE